MRIALLNDRRGTMTPDSQSYDAKTHEDGMTPDEQAASAVARVQSAHHKRDSGNTQPMDLDWLRRLDIHLTAYETTMEPMPLADLRTEIDMARFVCGIGPDPRPGEPCSNCDGLGRYVGWPHTTCPTCEGTGRNAR
jgi:hypothetical protein